MVSQKKVQLVKQVGEQIAKYPVIGIIDMHKLPGRQLFSIKNSLKGKAVIMMVKKRLIFRILENTKLNAIKDLQPQVQGEPALIMSSMDPFELSRMISQSKSRSKAKPGDIAPMDIVVNEGPTSLPPGPAIGDLQKAKIPCGVEGDKIVVKKDTVIVKKGEPIPPEMAALMGKLGIEPMEIGLNLRALWEKGIVYMNDILFITTEEYVESIKQAYRSAFNLSFNTGYLTKETVPLLLSKAHSEAVSLAMAAGIETEETLLPLMAKAQAQAGILKELIKEPESPAESAPAAEATGEKKEG